MEVSLVVSNDGGPGNVEPNVVWLDENVSGIWHSGLEKFHVGPGEEKRVTQEVEIANSVWPDWESYQVNLDITYKESW
jgi:hypothetical protein